MNRVDEEAGVARRWGRRSRRVIVALVLAIASLTLVTGTAFAANGGNPATTGCASNRVTIARTAPVMDGNRQVGTAYLKYSDGCQTQWVTVNYQSGYYADPSVWMQNQNGTNLYAVYRDSVNAYTYQLSNMKYQTGCGGVQMSQGSRYVGWTYLGCY